MQAFVCRLQFDVAPYQDSNIRTFLGLKVCLLSWHNAKRAKSAFDRSAQAWLARLRQSLDQVMHALATGCYAPAQHAG